MCFHSKQSKSAQELITRFNASFEAKNNYTPSSHINGFTFPATPVITNANPNKIQLFNWGFLPSWTNDITFRKNTLNAKSETLKKKPSFKPYINNRCLIIADGFYEWQWLDEKGKQKQKYLITMPNYELFCFAGLWNNWLDKATGKIINTYTILTTESNELMTEIHNSKKRMPLILTIENENNWLTTGKFKETNKIHLKAEKQKNIS